MSDGLASLFSGIFGSPNIQGPYQQYYPQEAATIGQGAQALQQAYQGAIPVVQQAAATSAAPYSNIYNMGTTGANAYLNALGLGGGSGGPSTAAAFQQFQATPTYQIPFQAAQQQISRQNATQGGGASGAALDAASKQAAGYAGQNWNNYVNQLYQTTPWMTQGAGGLSQAAQYGGTGTANLMTGGAQATTGQNNMLVSLLNQLAGAGAQQNVANWGSGIAGMLGLGQLASGLGGGLGTIGSGIGGALSSLFGPGSGGYSGVGGWTSDVRLKEDIEPVGKLFDGTNVYKFRYKGDSSPPRIGLMAQEVERRTPEAVGEVGGIKFVDYDRATRPSSALAMLMAA